MQLNSIRRSGFPNATGSSPPGFYQLVIPRQSQ
jgi:hypothetical protein